MNGHSIARIMFAVAVAPLSLPTASDAYPLVASWDCGTNGALAHDYGVACDVSSNSWKEWQCFEVCVECGYSGGQWLDGLAWDSCTFGCFCS